MERTFIDLIKGGTISAGWFNQKAGRFEYDSSNYSYRFVSTTKDLNCYLYAERDRNDENTPIVIKGFLAFLISCWGHNEQAVYDAYNESKKKAFTDIEGKKPGSFKRNLDKEFAKLLLVVEQNNLNHFRTTFDYISVEEKSLLLEYGKSYLEYTASIYKLKLAKETKNKSFESILHHNNKTALMQELHKLLGDTQGKKVAIVVKSLCMLGYLDIPSNRNELYRMLEESFGYIGTASNLNIYLSPDSKRLLDSELDPIIQILKRV